MADPQDRPDGGSNESPGAVPPVPPKKAPKKASGAARPAAPSGARAAKKAPAKKAPAKKAPPAKSVPPAALEPPATHAALAAGNGSPPLADAAREAAAHAKSTVEQAANPVTRLPAAPGPESGRSALPFAVAFAVTVLIALLIRRLRRNDDE